jgi:nucleotide-binding universal stress UspA family protein
VAEGQRFAARRILVGVDASAASLDAMAVAVALAARLGSILTGLFVEDEDLLRLAALGFADIVRTPGSAAERLDRASAEAGLRAVAAHAREALERTASSHRVTCTFRVARGRVVREVLAAAEEADLVVLGAAGHGRSGWGVLGETARAAAERARPPVLLIGRGSRLTGKVVGVDDGTPAGARAKAAASLLAAEGRPPATVEASGVGPAALGTRLARLDPVLVALPEGLAGLLQPLLATGVAVLLVR